jgi:predicted metal-dependent hydrolase
MQIDQIIRSRRKTIELVVRPDGSLLVRAPNRATLNQIRELVFQKADWIRSRKELVKQRKRLSSPIEYVDGARFFYLGETIPLHIVDQAVSHLSLKDEFFLDRKALPHAAEIFEKWYRNQSRSILTDRVAHYAGLYEFNYGKIRISGARTRWGSCGAKGSLNFSWRLIMAPLDVVDYVVVHELVHLIERNHSARFWGRVEQIMPDYKIRRKWLNTNGHLLTLD